jgi:hypothetical protein
LPLDQFCEAGGAPDAEGVADFTVDDCSEGEGEITVKSTVYFQELIPTACRDANFKVERKGTLILKIDRTTGSAEAEADPESECRNPENY